MRYEEGKSALRAGLLAPLSLALWIPLFYWLEQVIHGERLLWTIVAAIPLALLFGYVGFLLFGILLYAILRFLRGAPTVAIISACVIGAVAALVTPQLFEAVGSPEIAWSNLRTMAQTPSFWIDYISLSGAATGAVFWLLARPGRATDQN